METTEQPKLYGLVAQFDSGSAVLAAAEKAFEEGYRKMDAYTPYPIHGLSEALGFRKTKLTTLIFFGGVTGALGGFMLQYITAVFNYPFNISGKPYNSWPAFIPITFECMVLLAAGTAVLGMLALNGLPRPYHPLFNSEAFAHASRDKYFLCIESVDPKFDLEGTRRFLESLKPEEIDEVAP